MCIDGIFSIDDPIAVVVDEVAYFTRLWMNGVVVVITVFSREKSIAIAIEIEKRAICFVGGTRR